MEKLPRALQLADWLDEVNAVSHPIHTKSAAAELRRLHEANAELLAALIGCAEWMEGLRVSGDAGNWDWEDDEYTRARDAIAKATGEQYAD